MGGFNVFYETLQRKPVESWDPWEGPHTKCKIHKGIEPKNVPALIFDLCSNGESVDPNVYLLAQTTFSLNDVLDILELKEVQNSWQAAAMKNIEETKKSEIQVDSFDSVWNDADDPEE